MSLIIYDVSLPKDGLVRNISIFEDGSVRYYGGSSVIGKAIELPPHGDLIDRSKIVYTRDGSGFRTMEYAHRAQLENITPVISAEGE